MKALRGGLLALTLAAAPAHADVRTAKLDAYVAAQAAAGALNGNVLVAERGKVIYRRSFGYADFEGKRPNGADTGFELASISKVFTAIAVLQLVERHAVALDAPLARYVQRFPYPSVTVRQLLSHSSGLSEQELDTDAYEASIGRPIEMGDLAPAIAASHVAPKLKPAQKWWYSNLGYELLALLVEERSGLRFDAYLQRHVLGPAGMRHTYLRTATINRADTPSAARNYDYPFRFSSTRERLTGASGDHGGRLYGPDHLVSTTGDLLLLDRALRDGRLLKPATLVQAYAPQKLADGAPVFVWLDIGGMGDADDGLGWFIFRDRGYGRIVWHAGGKPGCATMFMRNLDKDQVVIVLDNTNSENLYRTALSALRILNGSPPVATPRSLTRLFGRALVAEGEDAALVTLLKRKDDAEHYRLSEDDLNNLAYAFADNGHLAEGLATLRAALALWPSSDNVNESYGELLERGGRAEDARAMYDRALRLNPRNDDARARIAAAATAAGPPAR